MEIGPMAIHKRLEFMLRFLYNVSIVINHRDGKDNFMQKPAANMICYKFRNTDNATHGYPLQCGTNV